MWRRKPRRKRRRETWGSSCRGRERKLLPPGGPAKRLRRRTLWSVSSSRLGRSPHDPGVMRARAALLANSCILCGWAVYMLMRPTPLSVPAGVRALRHPSHTHPHPQAAHPHQKSHEALRRGLPSIHRATAAHAHPPSQVRPVCNPHRCTRSHPARRARTRDLAQLTDSRGVAAGGGRGRGGWGG